MTACTTSAAAGPFYANYNVTRQETKLRTLASPQEKKIYTVVVRLQFGKFAEILKSSWMIILLNFIVDGGIEPNKTLVAQVQFAADEGETRRDRKQVMRRWQCEIQRLTTSTAAVSGQHLVDRRVAAIRSLVA